MNTFVSESILRGRRSQRRIVATMAVLAACLQVHTSWGSERVGEIKSPSTPNHGLVAQGGPVSAQGTWNFVMKTPVGDRKISFKFSVDGAVLKGTMTDDEGTNEIFNGSVDGAKLKWSAKVSKPMSMTLDFTGVIDGDGISGGAKSLFGTAKFTAQRV